MSPRRKVDAAERDYFTQPVVTPRPPRRWGLALTGVVSTLLAVAAIAGSVFMLVGHESQRRTDLRDVAALGYVRTFMIEYTSLDPFHANEYTENIYRQATGDFETSFKEKMNEITIQVARAEPTTGSVLDAGVQRWNDDGSAQILVAANVTTPGRDGRPTVESASRWVATTIEEGQQWKISQLIQVI
ncbi:mammalian cell entry protein [Mycolicibacterium sediminis]|uniref:Mammalian cell entry protein n=1 Tax=Mycolicibacterium sediminis TaxID=1286180 RepID=A0A7I7QLU7_9MYCO|nr:mammalian cell entry protein [Mycolicibacterium sediminis]BBY27359.1 hypothetical protein MSEDJ_14550 [Mycolicibacterium sediminis]